jgi:hypothetical protein
MIARLFASTGMKLLAATQIASIGLIALLMIAKAAETRRALKWEMRASQEAAAHAATIARVRQASADAKAADAANAMRVERSQTAISQETDRDYQAQLAAVRRRYDALRLRSGPAKTDPGGVGGAAMPGVPGAAGGADAAAAQDGLPPEDALIASEQALQLEALQHWVSGQVAVER